MVNKKTREIKTGLPPLIALTAKEVVEVIEALGNSLKVAEILQLPNSQTVSNWKKRGKIPRESQTLLQFLRPDIFKKIKRKG